MTDTKIVDALKAAAGDDKTLNAKEFETLLKDKDTKFIETLEKEYGFTIKNISIKQDKDSQNIIFTDGGTKGNIVDLSDTGIKFAEKERFFFRNGNAENITPEEQKFLDKLEAKLAKKTLNDAEFKLLDTVKEYLEQGGNNLKDLNDLIMNKKQPETQLDHRLQYTSKDDAHAQKKLSLLLKNNEFSR